jgi:hypothetical protein
MFYAGAEEKRAFASALQARAAGVAPETIEFALFDPLGIGYTPGANANAAVLDTCGRLALQADDDSVFRFALLPEGGPELRLSSEADPTEVRFFSDPGERERGVGLRDVDILAVHTAFLSRSVAECLRQSGGQADCGEIAPEFLSFLGAGRVAATMSGVCGDSGMSSSLFVLWLAGRSRELALQSEEHYRNALRSRQVVRAATYATLTHSTLFMKLGIGLDNRQAIPPFLPVMRSEDGLFGQSLRVCLPQCLIAHLPLAELHLPEEHRGFKDKHRTQPGLADLLAISLRKLAPARAPGIPEQRLRMLGSGLLELGSIPSADFQAILRELWAEELSRYILEMEQLLALHDKKPDYWAADAEDWLAHAQGALSAGQNLSPVDLPARADPQEAIELSRLLFRSYGGLFLAWLSLRNAAQQLAGETAGLARPL